jgi:hypothetical protein
MKFNTYTLAARALKLARAIVPNSYWYMTNEGGSWRVVEANA